jgi:DNA-binding CsgD family transcriptional regulator
MSTIVKKIVLLWAIWLPITSSAQHREVVDYISTLNSSFERMQTFAFFYDTLSSSAKRLSAIQSIYSQLENLDDDKLNQYILLHKDMAGIYAMDEVDQKVNYLHDLRQKHKDALSQGILLHSIAQNRFAAHQYVEAFRNASDADELFRNLGYSNVPGIVKYLHELALMHYFFGDYEQVLKLMDTSFHFAGFGQLYDIHRLNNMGLAYMGMQHFDKAETFFQSALAEAQLYHVRIWQGIIFENIGTLHFRKREYTAAFEKFLNAIEYIDSLASPNMYGRLLLQLAKVQLQLNKYNEAKYYISAYRDLQKPPRNFLGFKQQREKLNVLYYEVSKAFYFKTRAFEQAYLYADSFYLYSAKLDSTYSLLQLELIHQQLNSEKQGLQSELLSQERKLLAYRYTLLLILLALSFSIIFFIVHRKKEREKRAFLLKERSMFAQQKVLEEEIDHLKKKIQGHLHKIQENNQILEGIKSSSTEDDKSLNLKSESTLNTATLRILTKESWRAFQESFEQLHPEFTQRLKGHPARFSDAEVRLLMLAKLQFSNKEAKSILGVSDSAIRITWLRIRRKMELTGDANPSDIVNSFRNSLNL